VLALACLPALACLATSSGVPAGTATTMLLVQADLRF
jgi:hypothetical protein